MRITKRRIERAKKLLAKAEALEKEKEIKLRAEEKLDSEIRENRRGLIKTFRTSLEEELREKFEKENKPAFEVGEEVRIAYYLAGNNHWQISLPSYLKMINQDIGPKIVTITERYIDSTYLQEALDKMEIFEYEIINKLNAEIDYFVYKAAWEHYMRREKEERYPDPVPIVKYAYKFEYNGVNITENYGDFGEDNFVKVGSSAERIILEYHSLTEKVNKINDKQIELKKKKYRAEKRLNDFAQLNKGLKFQYTVNFPETYEEYHKNRW